MSEKIDTISNTSEPKIPRIWTRVKKISRTKTISYELIIQKGKPIVLNAITGGMLNIERDNTFIHISRFNKRAQNEYVT